ncbi:hypothetical protein RND71_042863 [Anisodus tanguticus]|uniref:Uncharacterized protein n=1 Tax=Anisodus tanguticus TaxID=243964 RepID=A0AAE1QRT1_9SOLA|nr:hypothetical protein RND71_042863 [Anisodus tanguticus]
MSQNSSSSNSHGRVCGCGVAALHLTSWIPNNSVSLMHYRVDIGSGKIKSFQQDLSK